MPRKKRKKRTKRSATETKEEPVDAKEKKEAAAAVTDVLEPILSSVERRTAVSEALDGLCGSHTSHQLMQTILPVWDKRQVYVHRDDSLSLWYTMGLYWRTGQPDLVVSHAEHCSVLFYSAYAQVTGLMDQGQELLLAIADLVQQGQLKLADAESIPADVVANCAFQVRPLASVTIMKHCSTVVQLSIALHLKIPTHVQVVYARPDGTFTRQREPSKSQYLL